MKMQQQLLNLEKENKKLQQTNSYLQQELVKSGKKFPTKDSGGGGSMLGGTPGGFQSGTPPPKPPAPWQSAKSIVKFSSKKKS